MKKRKNPIFRTDSYKYSHPSMYLEDATEMQSHFCARGGEFELSRLYGMQYDLIEYGTDPILPEDVAEAAELLPEHGVPFFKKGFDKIVDQFGGYMPIQIYALPEGLPVPVGTPLYTVKSAVSDPDLVWCVGFVETRLSRLWYPSTIATASAESYKILKQYLELSSDTPEEIVFKLHDFGARGTTCAEQASLGGAAHNLSFLGSDTMEGIEFARHYYGERMSANSIRASEHSTVTMGGRDKEFDFYRNFIKTQLTDVPTIPGVPKLAACVSDSYNLWEAVKFWTEPQQLKQIKESGGTLVIRPDSGEPTIVLQKLFNMLEQRVGMPLNGKGYKLLPPYLRVIQGDGIDRKSMEKILDILVKDCGISASNLAFGSGGGLLQNVNRDTQKFAYKCNAAKINGKWVPVSKDPITDPGKRSRAGYISDDRLELVYDCGKITRHETFANIRARMSL